MWLSLVGVVVSVAVLVGGAVLLAEADVDTAVAMTIVFLLGLIVLVAIIGMLVIGFRSVGLSSNKQALGLPEGSIRALLALILVLSFVFTSIYLVERVFLQDGPGPEAAQNVALSIVSIFGTLVTAAMAFYFGANAVKSGAAVTAAVVQPSRPPTATTKGNEEPAGGKVVVVGFVNPRGRETQWLFEYGETTDYGHATGLEVVGAGEKDVLVKAEIEHTGPLNVRVVALNDAGRARGANHEIPPPTGEQAAPAEDTPPPDVVVEGDVHVGGDVVVQGEDQTETAEVAEPVPDDDEFDDEETLEDDDVVDDLESQSWEDEVDDFEEEVAAAEAEITEEPPPGRADQ
jgi:hypothetical protein